MSRMGGLFSVIAAFLHYRIKVRIYEAHIEKYVITCRQRLIIQRLKRKNIINPTKASIKAVPISEAPSVNIANPWKFPNQKLEIK